MSQRCCHDVEMSQKFIDMGVDAQCQKVTKKICKECGNYFCYIHIKLEKHNCESLGKSTDKTGSDKVGENSG